MKIMIWKLIGLAELALVSVYYHVFSGMGSVYTPRSGVWYEYVVEVDGKLFIDPTWRAVGYVVLAALALLVIFADKVEERLLK